MINLRELMAFRAVMTTGTTVGAARVLNLSQPSVSRLLGELEARLQVVLFRREAGRLLPSHDALLLLEEVERAFESLEALAEFTGRLSNAVARPIRLAISPGLAYRFAPRAVALFGEVYPKIPIIIDMQTTDTAAEFVANAHADLAAVLLPTHHPGVRVLPLIDAPILAAMLPEHPLAGSAVLSPAELDGQNLIVISKRFPARIRIDEAFERAGALMRIRVESGTSAAACGAAEAGLGIALVNAFMAREFARSRLVLVPFQPLIQVSFGMLLSRTAPPRATLALVDCLRAAAREQLGTVIGEPNGPAPALGASGAGDAIGTCRVSIQAGNEMVEPIGIEPTTS